MDPKSVVRAAFQELLVEGGFEDAADRWFSPDYRQSVDGRALDFAGFRSHMAALRRAVREIRIDFDEMIAEGNVVTSRHRVRMRIPDGPDVETRIIAFFEVEDGKIFRCDELMQMSSGGPSARDLGSRTG